MSTIRQHLVFLTGHRISARTSAEEVGSLSKIGAAIAFASFLAALQFGIAGWFLAMDLHILLQMLMALVFAFIGAAIVLVLDRNFIYLADTRYETDKKLTYVYLGIRIFLITVIGTLSSQFTQLVGHTPMYSITLGFQTAAGCSFRWFHPCIHHVCGHTNTSGTVFSEKTTYTKV